MAWYCCIFNEFSLLIRQKELLSKAFNHQNALISKADSKLRKSLKKTDQIFDLMSTPWWRGHSKANLNLLPFHITWLVTNLTKYLVAKKPCYVGLSSSYQKSRAAEPWWYLKVGRQLNQHFFGFAAHASTKYRASL